MDIIGSKKIKIVIHLLQAFFGLIIIAGTIGYAAGITQSFYIKTGGINIGKIASYGLIILVLIYFVINKKD